MCIECTANACIACTAPDVPVATCQKLYGEQCTKCEEDDKVRGCTACIDGYHPSEDTLSCEPDKTSDASCSSLGLTVAGGVGGSAAGFPVWDPQVTPGGKINEQTTWPGQYTDNTKCLMNNKSGYMVANFTDMTTSGYGTINVPVGGHLCKEPSQCGTDLSPYTGMKLTYSSTFDFDLQLRTAKNPHRDDHNYARLKGTSGKLQAVFLTWDQFKYGPGEIDDDVLRDVYSFTFAAYGNKKNHCPKGTFGSSNNISVSYFEAVKKTSADRVGSLSDNL